MEKCSWVSIKLTLNQKKPIQNRHMSKLGPSIQFPQQIKKENDGQGICLERPMATLNSDRKYLSVLNYFFGRIKGRLEIHFPKNSPRETRKEQRRTEVDF